MPITKLDVKEYVSALAVSSITPAVGCVIIAIAIKNTFDSCQTSTLDDITLAALKTGASGGTFMLFNDLAYRLYGSFKFKDKIRLELPSYLDSTVNFLSISGTLLSMFVGALEGQSNECQDAAIKIIPGF